MSVNKPHTSYTLADIERYLQGKLSPAEMHALEKAALQDPFLADALEGYQSADLSTAKDHLDEIQRRLQSRDKDSVPVIIPAGTLTKWWRVAAIALLVLGAGSISLYLFNNTPATPETAQQSLPATTKAVIVPPLADEQQKQLAQTDKPGRAEKTKAAARPQANAPKTDAVAGKEQASASLVRGELISVRDLDSNAIASLARSAPDRLNNKEEEKIELPLALQGRVPGVQVNPANKNNGKIVIRGSGSVSTARVQRAFTGQVTDSSGQPVAGAIVRIGNGDRYVAANDKGDFRFSLPDTVSRIEITAVGFETQQQQLLPGKQYQIVLRSSDHDLSEVIVTGYGAKRRTATTGSVTVAEEKIITELMPADGWSSFNNYLSEKTSTIRSRNIGGKFSGIVEAELNLNRKGKVKEVTILSTFNTSMNELIIRLIKEGPVWLLADGKPAQGKKKITIQL